MSFGTQSVRLADREIWVFIWRVVLGNAESLVLNLQARKSGTVGIMKRAFRLDSSSSRPRSLSAIHI
jgi:hypothetical protein